MKSWKPNNKNEALSGSVYFEFIPIGRAVKVIAMCAVTGEEVAIVGDAKATQKELQTLALRRLSRKIETAHLPTQKNFSHLTSSSYH